MKKLISVFCAAVLFVSMFTIAYAQDTVEIPEEIAAAKAVCQEIEDIDASDARDVLLYSAGLKKDGVNENVYDADGDGMITAIDARVFLRIAAQLETSDNYFKAIKYDYFLTMINSIKPAEYKYYESVIDEIQDVTYKDNGNVVSEMNRQLGLYAEYDSSMAGYDFGKELTASKGDKNSTYATSRTAIKTKDNYPVLGNDLACLAAVSDISKVEMRKNQSFTYTRKSTVGDRVLYEETVTGLDSITVYFNSESVSLEGNLDGRFDNLNVAKAFNALQAADVEEMLATNSSFDGVSGMEGLGKCDISMLPKTLKYDGCFITIYFYPDTNIPVGTVHNLKYQMMMRMGMDIDIPAKALADGAVGVLLQILTLKNNGNLLKVNGTVDITNTMNVETKVYFRENNPDHVIYR